MAKQLEGFLVGTFDDITFYKMEGMYYARMKSSLTGKKFWKHKSFEGSRRSCNRFGRGNQLASIVYNEIPEMKRRYEIFCRMKREAIAMLKAGEGEEVVKKLLRALKPKLARRVKHSKCRIQIEKRCKKKAFLFRPVPMSAFQYSALGSRYGKGANESEHNDRIPVKKSSIIGQIHSLRVIQYAWNSLHKEPP